MQIATAGTVATGLSSVAFGDPTVVEDNNAATPPQSQQAAPSSWMLLTENGLVPCEELPSGCAAYEFDDSKFVPEHESEF